MLTTLLPMRGGNCIVAGALYVPSNGVGQNPFNRDLYVCKTDPDGNFIWNLSGGNPGRDDFTSRLAISAQNQIFLTAGSEDYNTFFLYPYKAILSSL